MPIASEQLGTCELFLTAQPNLYTSYDVFYVHLLPCPLGFTLQRGICECDPDLRKYIDECIISSQTVRRLSNVYISVISAELQNSTDKYTVSSNCPVEYCLQSSSIINLYNVDAQCQHHRTGILCSQCVTGYSMVFGSSRCKKCTNLSLFYILSYLFTGLLLAIILFSLNLTVTTGTTNCLILYTNIIQINRSFFNIEGRLVKPMFSYISTVNLGSQFETCFYNGMTTYAKKWLLLTYPFYFILIATSFILGSRYSSKLYRLTFNKSLPVLATLFMVSYTSVLLIIASAFLYITITQLPSHSSSIVWLYDPTLFGWKFLIFISVCLLLFLFLIVFNAILLFTKPLMRFKVIHRFKPGIN